MPQGLCRVCVDPLDGIDRCWREAGGRLWPRALQRLLRTREDKGVRVECRLARCRVIDDAVEDPIKMIACGKYGALKEHLIRHGKRRVKNRIAVWKRPYRFRSDSLDVLDAPGLTERDCFQIIDRIARYDPVVVVGEVLRKYHALPTARGASDEVGAIRLLTIVSIDEKLCCLRGHVYRTVGVVDDRLLFEVERIGVGQMTVLMSTVLACNRPTVSKRRGKRPRLSRGRRRPNLRVPGVPSHAPSGPHATGQHGRLLHA